MTTTIDNAADYSELDYALDQIEDLQTMLAAANMGDVSPEDKEDAKNFIAEQAKELKTLRMMNKQLVISRNTFQNQAAELQSQINRQRRELDKLKKAPSTLATN